MALWLLFALFLVACALSLYGIAIGCVVIAAGLADWWEA